MSQRRILLIDYVDAAGAAARDVLVRTAALNRAGCAVRAVVIEKQDRWGLHASPSGAGGVERLYDDDAGRTRLKAIVEEAQPETTLVSSAAPGGGTVGRWLGQRGDARWWPSAIGTSNRHADGTSGRVSSGPLSALEHDSDEPPALHWSTLEYSRLRRSQLPLWDGHYLLSPVPLAGRSGETAMRAFAELCDANDELDLVVLSDPQPVFVDMARQLRIGLRVHFAGVAPRDAEVSWLTSAVGAFIVGDGPVSAGLILRALACRCPLLPVRGGALADTLAPWLEASDLAMGALDAENGIGALRNVVVPGRRLDAVLERGHRLAEAATAEVAGRRLAAALDLGTEERRAA